MRLKNIFKPLRSALMKENERCKYLKFIRNYIIYYKSIIIKAVRTVINKEFRIGKTFFSIIFSESRNIYTLIYKILME